MEYIYAALLLHAAKKDITEEAVTKVLGATGEKPDAARVKALVASLDGVNIEDAIKQAAAAPVAAAPAANAPKESKKEESKEDEGKRAEEAAAGLSSLFG